jgi:hypothetical protein
MTGGRALRAAMPPVTFSACRTVVEAYTQNSCSAPRAEYVRCVV